MGITVLILGLILQTIFTGLLNQGDEWTASILFRKN
jgi:hypothetical protein